MMYAQKEAFKQSAFEQYSIIDHISQRKLWSDHIGHPDSDCKTKSKEPVLSATLGGTATEAVV